MNESTAMAARSDGDRSVEAMTADEVRAAIDRHIRDINRSKLQLAPLLARVKAEKWYLNWGYPTFQAFLQEQLQFNPKTAQALLRIERAVIGRAGISRDDVYVLGFAKALALAPMALAGRITDANRADIVTRAKSMTVETFKADLKPWLDSDQPPSSSPHTGRPKWHQGLAEDAAMERPPSPEAARSGAGPEVGARPAARHMDIEFRTSRRHDEPHRARVIFTPEQMAIVQQAFALARDRFGGTPTELWMRITEHYLLRHGGAIPAMADRPEGL